MHANTHFSPVRMQHHPNQNSVDRLSARRPPPSVCLDQTGAGRAVVWWRSRHERLVQQGWMSPCLGEDAATPLRSTSVSVNQQFFIRYMMDVWARQWTQVSRRSALPPGPKNKHHWGWRCCWYSSAMTLFALGLYFVFAQCGPSTSVKTKTYDDARGTGNLIARDPHDVPAP